MHTTTRAPRKPRVTVIGDGYSAGHKPGERLDCAVRAVMTAACLTYEQSHALFKRHGRRDGRRTFTRTSVAVIREIAPAYRYIGLPGVTVQGFAELYRSGHWVVQVSGHMLAICDGDIHDWPGRSVYRRVKQAWRIV